VNPVERLALSLGREGDVVLDIGAGSGGFSGAALDSGMVVIAVEGSRRRVDHLRASLESPRLRVLHCAVVRPGGASERFVHREGVNRMTATAADDGEVVEAVSLADLVSRFAPRLVRVRAAGHESALADVDVPITLVSADALTADAWPLPDHLTDIADGLRRAKALEPIVRSRHHALFGSAVDLSAWPTLTRDDQAGWAETESYAREPLRRVTSAIAGRSLPIGCSSTPPTPWLMPWRGTTDRQRRSRHANALLGGSRRSTL
jgi:FkbM family methyltransferase